MVEFDQFLYLSMEEETMKETEVAEEINRSSNDPNLNRVVLPGLVPHVGMEFTNSDEAWACCLSYSGQQGFEVRKRYTNKRASDGKVTSCKFVCANEGHRSQDKRDHLTKLPRAETRTDCQVHMSVNMDRKKENLKVTKLILEHNHTLHLPETLHLMVSQRKISELQAFEIEMADDAGIGPKKPHMSLQVVKLVEDSILAIPSVITRIICGRSANEKWHMAKQVACLSIFKTRLLKTHHSNMHCKWIVKNK